jgi:hypothetical protein
VKTKRCSKCGETKPLSEFYANRKPTKGRPGLKSACKDCEKTVRTDGRDTAPKPPLPTAAEMRAWHRAGCRLA